MRKNKSDKDLVLARASVSMNIQLHQAIMVELHILSRLVGVCPKEGGTTGVLGQMLAASTRKIEELSRTMWNNSEHALKNMR